jgi:hypothetical protein
MPDGVQVRAVIPRELKRRAFVALAVREEKFSSWLRNQLESWLQDVTEASAPGRNHRDVGLAQPETCRIAAD